MKGEDRMNSEQEFLEILTRLGAVITESHVVYTSGKHGVTYINKDAVYPHTWETSRLCRVIAQHFVNENVEVVIAPAVGGVILSQWTAFHLSEMNRYEVFGVYADKVKYVDADPGGVVEWEDFAIKRGYDKFVADKRVLVVEDVLNTGYSVAKVVKAARAINGHVVGVGALCNRGGVTKKDIGDVPELFALVNVKLEAWNEADCPLCTLNIPINADVGKGREFLGRKRS